MDVHYRGSVRWIISAPHIVRVGNMTLVARARENISVENDPCRVNNYTHAFTNTFATIVRRMGSNKVNAKGSPFPENV